MSLRMRAMRATLAGFPSAHRRSGEVADASGFDAADPQTGLIIARIEFGFARELLP
jgi:hypothetical protein